MSVTLITAVIVGLIITALLLVWFNQWRQRNNDIKRRRISQLANQLKRYQALTQSIPARYIDTKILLLLLQTSRHALHQIVQLEPATKSDAQLNELTALEKKITTGKAIAPAIDASNETAGKELRQNLQALFKFISEQARKGNLDKKYANQQLIKTQFYRAESLANAHVKQATVAEKALKFRVAIHHLHDAIAAFAKTPKNAAAEQAISQYRQKITQLDVLANQQSMKKTGCATTADDHSLGAQLEQMNDTDSTWKKKQDYED